MKPKKVNILGKEYKIIYVNNPAEVDNQKRTSLWGQIDYWERIMRVYDNGSGNRGIGDIWDSIVHEILHGLAQELNIKCLQGESNEDTLGILAMGLTDVLLRNGWLKK